MKPYKILNQQIIDKKRGLVDDTFTRFICTGDSLFSIFLRSFGHRTENPIVLPEYIIIDKNLSHLRMFEELLQWDGNVADYYVKDEVVHYNSFENNFYTAKAKHQVRTQKFPRNSTLNKIIRYDFQNFTESWNLFKTCKFRFVHLDIITENDKFLTLLDKLPDLPKKTNQFVKLDFNHDNNIDKHNESINNILHNLWLKNIKQYSSVVEIADENNDSIEDYAGKLYAKMNPTFCILPWMHIQYKPSGQSKLCCRYDNLKEIADYNLYRDKGIKLDNISHLLREKDNLIIQKSSIENSFDSNYWNTARNYTLQNKPISGCHKCYQEENVNGEVAVSMRLGSSILYNEGYLHKKPKFVNPKLEFLEVGFGNYCNLACLTCNSTLSTTWHDDEVQLNSKLDKSMQRLIFPKLDNLVFNLEEDTIRNLKIIKFTGGEPMINPEFVKFINNICEKGIPSNINLEIYTNCSYIPSPKLLENLTKFKNVQLNLSIDALGDINDYIRYGSKWQGDGKQTVSKSIDFWLDIGKNNENIKIIMSSTVSILNILEMPKLISWWMDKFKNSENKITVFRTSLLATEYDGFFKIQPAYDPSYLNLNILPKEYYEEVQKWIEHYKETYINFYPDLGRIPECIGSSLHKLEKLISKSNGNIAECKKFLTYLETIDEIRKNSADNYIPSIVNKVKKYIQTQDKSL